MNPYLDEIYWWDFDDSVQILESAIEEYDKIEDKASPNAKNLKRRIHNMEGRLDMVLVDPIQKELKFKIPPKAPIHLRYYMERLEYKLRNSYDDTVKTRLDILKMTEMIEAVQNDIWDLEKELENTPRGTPLYIRIKEQLNIAQLNFDRLESKTNTLLTKFSELRGYRLTDDQVLQQGNTQSDSNDSPGLTSFNDRTYKNAYRNNLSEVVHMLHARLLRLEARK